MLTISKEIKNIQNIFKTYFKNNKSNFDLNNIEHTTISILGLMHVFIEKPENYKEKIIQYNKKYDEIISELPVHYCNEDQIYSIVHFYNEDLKFYEFDYEIYKHLSNSNAIILLADKILTKNKIYKNFEHYEYFKKISIFIVVKYLIEHERTKNETAINLFFNNCYDFTEILAKEIFKNFKIECEIFYGEAVNTILIENAIFEVDEQVLINIVENKDHPYEELKFLLIKNSVDIIKLDQFSNEFMKKHSEKYDNHSIELFKLAMFHIFTEIVKLRS